VPLGSFEAFYRQEHRHLVRIVYALCGSWSVAEEVSQEAFLKALRRWSHVQQMDRPDAWLRRVACNLATSRFRRRAIEARVLLRLSSRHDAPNQEEQPAGLDRFWRLVRQLPRRQAQAVALYYADDLSIDEVARVMGCAPGTVKAHLHAARQQLSELYGEQEGHGP
jgi:RNA polymerase sigma factor (sigma-70 family)